MYPKTLDCGDACRSESPANEAFTEVHVALKMLREAVERIGMKTNEVRYCRPCDPCKDGAMPNSGCSPLISRLREIRDDISRQVDTLNSFSDEIQL